MVGFMGSRSECMDVESICDNYHTKRYMARAQAWAGSWYPDESHCIAWNAVPLWI